MPRVACVAAILLLASSLAEAYRVQAPDLLTLVNNISEAANEVEDAPGPAAHGAAFEARESARTSSVLLGSFAQKASSASRMLVAAQAQAGLFWGLTVVEFFAVLYTVVCVVWFCKTLCSDLVVAKKRQQVKEKSDELHEMCDAESKQLLTVLEDMVENSSTLAEMNFRDKQRSFQRNLNDIVKDTSRINRHPDTELTGLFRRWLLSWLRVFEQCSLNPIEEPNILCSESELRDARTVAGMAQLVSVRLKENPVHFIAEDINQKDLLRTKKKGGAQIDDFRRALREASDAEGGRVSSCCCSWCCCCCRRYGHPGCGLCSWMEFACGCGVVHPKDASCEDDEAEAVIFPIEVYLGIIKVTILSAVHVRLLLFLLAGLTLTGYLFLQQKPITAGLVAVACLLLLVLLLCVDTICEHSRLEREVRELEKKNARIAKQSALVKDAYTKMQTVINLWRYQTAPRLEYFAELDQVLKYQPDVTKAVLLEELVPRLEEIDKGMGDLSLWIGSSALEESKLRMAAAQMDAWTQALSKLQQNSSPTKVLRSMHRIFGFLTVRVIACYDLPKKQYSYVSSALNVHVAVLAEESSHSFRTRTIQNDDLSPRWCKPNGPFSEEYFMSLKPKERKFTLQVWGDNGPSDATRFGYLSVKFVNTPGQWVRKREKLFNMKTKQVREKGEIEYAYFYASCVDELAKA